MKAIKRTDLIYYRVIATVFIFLCHIFGNSDIPLLQMSSQFFNVGVSMFIVLSGYLYGVTAVRKPVEKWYLKRWFRIAAPEYLFAAILFALHLILSKPIKAWNWIALLFNLQGLEIYVNGAEHLWYLTVILFCYLITPLLDRLFDKENRSDLKILTVIVSILIGSIVCAYLIHKHTAIYLLYILLYISAFLLGRYFNKLATGSNVLLCLLVACVFAALRVLGRIYANESTLYDVFIVGITQGVIALSGLCAVCSFKNLHSFTALEFLDKISYEFYLVHYMFIVGPVSLLNVTTVVPLNWLIVLSVSLMSAWLLSVVDGKIMLLFAHRKMRKKA